MPLKRHQALEIQHEIDALVEHRQRLERVFELERQAPRLGVALGRALAKLDQAQHLARQNVADAGDDAGGPAIDDAMEHLGVDADHERNPGLPPGNMLRGVAQRFGAAELLEPDEMRVFPAQIEEQLRPGLEAIIGAVVDDRRQVDRRLENAGEMAALGRRRRAAREDARDDHQPPRAFCLGVTRERCGLRGVLRPGADDDRQAGVRQALDALHPLLQSQERPVAHRSAIDEPRHPRVDELAAGAHEGVEIRAPIGVAGRHQSRNGSGKNLRGHAGGS